MELTEYQTLAQRTSSGKSKLNLPPDMTRLLNGAVGLNGEGGEVIDIVKKHIFQDHDLDQEKLLDEAGDCLWYLAELAAGMHTTLEEIAWHNVEKLRERYPQGFSAERSRNREI